MTIPAVPQLLAALLASLVGVATTSVQAQAAQEPSGAASPTGESKPAELAWGAATQQITRDRRASQLIGTQVRNWKGEDLGEIRDVVIDVNHGRVPYAVLSFGGKLLGLGDKLFAYPVTLFRQGTGDELILNVPQEALERAPGFERSRWPDWGDRSYWEKVNRYHGPKVSVPSSPNQQLRRASALIGAQVEDAQGRPAGEVLDVVADLSKAEVRYIVLDLAPSWGPDGTLLALPIRSFAFPAQGDRNIVLQTPREAIDMSRAFREEKWPNFEDKAYRSGTDGIPGGAPAAPASGAGQRRP